MLLARNFLTIPSYFVTRVNTKRDYNHSYNLLRWSVYVLTYKNMDGLNIVDFKIHSEHDPNQFYYVSIGTTDIVITPNSKVKVYCSCPDFAYTFAYVLHKYDSLLYENEFPSIFLTVSPKKRNPAQIPFVCKHVYTILKYCIINKISFNEQTVLKYNKRNMILRPIFEITFRFYKLIDEMRKKHPRRR